MLCDARTVVPMPPSLTFAEAATVPTVFLTAYECLREAADAKTGSRVLVHAATGKFYAFMFRKVSHRFRVRKTLCLAFRCTRAFFHTGGWSQPGHNITKSHNTFLQPSAQSCCVLPMLEQLIAFRALIKDRFLSIACVT